MTVEELRAVLKDLPGDMPISVEIVFPCFATVRRSPAYDTNLKTAEVHRCYGEITRLYLSGESLAEPPEHEIVPAPRPAIRSPQAPQR